MSQTIWSLPLQSLSVFFLLSYLPLPFSFRLYFFPFSNLLFHKKNCSDTWHITHNTHSNLTRKKDRKMCVNKDISLVLYTEKSLGRLQCLRNENNDKDRRKFTNIADVCLGFQWPVWFDMNQMQYGWFMRKENVWKGLCLSILIQQITYLEKKREQ